MSFKPTGMKVPPSSFSYPQQEDREIAKELYSKIREGNLVRVQGILVEAPQLIYARNPQWSLGDLCCTPTNCAINDKKEKIVEWLLDFQDYDPDSDIAQLYIKYSKTYGNQEITRLLSEPRRHPELLIVLLLGRELAPLSPFYKASLPLDLFKLIVDTAKLGKFKQTDFPKKENVKQTHQDPKLHKKKKTNRF